MLDNKVRLSVIVPVYKVEHYLHRCVKSILSQDIRENVEIILVDDGSPDSCPAICDEYARLYSNVKVIHKQNAGLGYARNTGLEHAIGEYVFFVDSDDFLAAGALKMLLGAAESSHADVILGGYCRDKEGIIIYKSGGFGRTRVVSGLDCLNSMLKHELEYSVWHGIYRLETIMNNGVRFVSERNVISEDITFHLALLPFCKHVLMIPDVVYHYCLNNNSITITSSFKGSPYSSMVRLCQYVENKVLENSIPVSRETIDVFFLDDVFSCMSLISKYDRKSMLSEYRIIANDQYFRNVIGRIHFSSLPVRFRLPFCFMKLNIPSVCVLLFLLRRIKKD